MPGSNVDLPIHICQQKPIAFKVAASLIFLLVLSERIYQGHHALPQRPYGFVFLNCKLTGDSNPWVDPATGQPKSRPGALAYLGRLWHDYGV